MKMKQWNRGAAVVAAALGIAGAVAVIPTASADTDGSTYAAIAYSPTTGKSDMVWNSASQLTADNHAVAGCNNDGKSTDCLVAAEGNYCVALATNPDPNDNAAYSGGHGMTKAAADQMALAGQSGLTIQGDQCND
jgi:hypothetical protein